jgi:outer membrane receptor protein involved in Fe transport
VSSNAFAGTIKGKVTDAANGTPLSGVIVNIKNTDKGMPTDIDGNYEFKDLPDGTYEVAFSMITYSKQTLNAVIKGNNEVILNVKLKAEGGELKTVTVKTTRTTRTENAVILEMRKSSSIVSGISASQIQKTMDRNAADVVKRVPGVTIQDDKFIIVRGLADRYNTVWLNDAGAPSSEIDRKSFSFDMIPSGLIDRILVFKTPSPELPGDFAGGMIKVYTTSIPQKNSISIGFQTSYRSGSTGTSYNYNQPSGTDWLGYDDGSRSLPSSIPSTKFFSTDPNISAITKAFNNDWVIKNKTLGLDGRFNASIANIFNVGNIKIGNTFGLAYANTSSNYSINRKEWVDTTPVYDYTDKQSENKVNAGFLDNVAMLWGNNKIEFKNLYNQSGKSTLTERTDANNPELNAKRADELGYAMAYESRAVYTSQLSGTHTSRNDERKYNWTLGYTDLFWNQPDLRRILYTRQIGDTVFKAQVARQPDIYLGGGRYYAQLYEHIYSFNHQFSQKVHIDSSYTFEVSAGNYLEYKSRAFNARELGYTLKSFQPDTLNSLPINQIFAQQNVGGIGQYRIEDGTNDYDKYSATNTLIASYLMVKLPVGGRINISGGARYEHNTQTLVSYINGTDTITPKVTTNYLLPSINISYNFTQKSLLRLAYGKTLNRPEFREWSPSVYYDFDDKALIFGSLNPAGTGDTLKVCQIQNIDARWEWYPSNGEMIHAGVFYKSFRDPIQRIILQGGSDSKQITFANGNTAYAMGIELDIRKNLGFADEWFGTNSFKNFAFVGNLSIIKSELTIDSAATRLTDQFKTSSLQGQSPYVINIGLFYQNDSAGLQGSLLYNVAGPRMYALGRNLPGQESIGEMPFKSMDLVLMKEIHNHYIISLGIQNLLDSKVLFLKDINRDGKFDTNSDLEYKSLKPGRYFTIGLKVKF